MEIKWNSYDFENNLKKISRKRKNKDIACALNISETTLSKWINGSQMPKISDLINIANTFNCSIDQLVGLSNTMQQLTFRDLARNINALLFSLPDDFISINNNQTKIKNGFRYNVNIDISFPVDFTTDKYDTITKFFSCMHVMELFYNNSDCDLENERNEIINNKIMEIQDKTFQDILHE